MAILLGSCHQSSNTSDSTKSTTKESKSELLSKYYGSYADDSFSKRNEGYDWVGVTISSLNDSSATIAVRSRTDIKKPTCTYDGIGIFQGSDSLISTFDGKNIVFAFTDSTVTISTQNPGDNNLLYYFCSGGATMAGTYHRIQGTLPTSK